METSKTCGECPYWRHLDKDRGVCCHIDRVTRENWKTSSLCPTKDPEIVEVDRQEVGNVIIITTYNPETGEEIITTEPAPTSQDDLIEVTWLSETSGYTRSLVSWNRYDFEIAEDGALKSQSPAALSGRLCKHQAALLYSVGGEQVKPSFSVYLKAVAKDARVIASYRPNCQFSQDRANVLAKLQSETDFDTALLAADRLAVSDGARSAIDQILKSKSTIGPEDR